ncbi:MAG: DNA/RNA non-specific endonuclease [Flectobacillus sp.]|nr:DNA/RNA non-specific endonuclease [Flectobacillus sp.]
MKTTFFKKNYGAAFLFGCSLFLNACVSYVPTTTTSTPPVVTSSSVKVKVATNFPEGFDDASKNKYEGGTISVSSGQWYLENAMMGSADNDSKHGTKAIRVKESGKISMAFDVPTGIQQLKFNYAVYQLDQSVTFDVYLSKNGGSSWTRINSTTATNKVLKELSLILNTAEACRIEIRKTDGTSNRLNIDDLSIVTYQTGTYYPPAPPTPSPSPTPSPNKKSVATRDNNLTLGNPSGAVKNTSYEDNYLMEKQAYSLSYNRNKGTANWISWHLSSAWKGETPRQNDFRPDDKLPQGWYAVTPRDYANTGFDRGHLCPSDDRDGDLLSNQESFYMTNMAPQAPEHNRGIWKSLEEYTRNQLGDANEVYVIAGVLGKGGTGANGTAQTIGKNNDIIVPVSLWKIIVILPIGENDASRVNANTRIIAVNIPNKNSLEVTNWRSYRVSVDMIEKLTGYDFLSNVPTDIQRIIEARVDDK